MYAKKKIISIIPARGGSKSIPYKNIVSLAGSPMIVYSIKHSLGSKHIDRTIVSTDSEKIADIAKSHGAEVLFLRPKKLARDHTPDFPVFHHALKWLKDNESYEPEIIVQLRPTSPIRPKGLIDRAIRHISKYPEADCLRTFSVAPITPYKMWKTEGLYMRPVLSLKNKESYNMDRHRLPLVYWHNGVVDIIRRTTIMDKKTMSGNNILPFFMRDTASIVDIDSRRDLLVAEAMFKELKSKKKYDFN